MIKKLLSFLIVFTLSVFLILLFCSCGTTAVTSELSPSTSDAPFSHQEPSFSETVETSSFPSSPVDETSSESEGKREIAISLIGQDISLLYEAIGEPISAEYSLSCNGPGDDGLLTYDGFIVFTYREDGVETVFDVM